MVALKKKRNPQDATLRNITALKKRVAALEETVTALEISVAFLKNEQGGGYKWTLPIKISIPPKSRK